MKRGDEKEKTNCCGEADDHVTAERPLRLDLLRADGRPRVLVARQGRVVPAWEPLRHRDRASVV